MYQASRLQVTQLINYVLLYQFTGNIVFFSFFILMFDL